MEQNCTLMRIKYIMKLNDYNVYRLAKESGIPYSSLNNLFKRNTEPTLPTLKKICAGLGVSLSEFFSDEHTPKRKEYTIDERVLISLYQNLKSSDRKLLMTYALALNKKIPK